MNERIKKLAEQAANYADKNATEEWGSYPGRYYDVFQERFAELIIGDCYEALRPMLRDMISRGHAYDLIKKHFGVEK